MQIYFGGVADRQLQDHPLLEWTREVDGFLAEMLRLEGRGEFKTDLCTSCQAAMASFRCRDCQDLHLYCCSCSVKQHERNPFHHIMVCITTVNFTTAAHDTPQSWTKDCFSPTTLKIMGLRLQLGHPIGEHCVNPVQPKGDDFTVIDTTGVHSIAVDFCGCGHAQSHTVQLLRHRLFPATTTYPQTAATFRVLEAFHLLSNQSKISAMEYYASLARLSNNTGVDASKVPSSLFASRALCSQCFEELLSIILAHGSRMASPQAHEMRRSWA